jgi:dTDP-4-dehydrorhamnose 3,5-epimerase
MTLAIVGTPLAGLWEVQTSSQEDPRGGFTRLFCTEAFAPIREGLRFVQVNRSITARRGTVRGLHFQRAPMQEAKLVRCLRGRVFDVAVDLRPGSDTFGRWHAVELSDTNERSLFIPEGFAHGFQALTDDAHLLYQHTASFSPEHEGGVHHADPSLDIPWPLPAVGVSARDRGLPGLHSALTRAAAPGNAE